MALVAALSLGACDRGVELTNASFEDVAAATAGAEHQRPGNWAVTTELESLELGDGGNGTAAGLIRQQIGRKQTTSACLTQEQASAIGVPGPDAMKGATCRFDHFTMKSGMLDATMRCTRPDGRMTVTQQGSYGADAYDLRSTVRQESGIRPGMAMTMRVIGRRTGACPTSAS